VVIHHMPGYDEGMKEITRKFAAHGYLAVCPNLYSREAPGASLTTPRLSSGRSEECPTSGSLATFKARPAFSPSLESSNGRVARSLLLRRQAVLPGPCSLPLDRRGGLLRRLRRRNSPEGGRSRSARSFT